MASPQTVLKWDSAKRRYVAVNPFAWHMLVPLLFVPLLVIVSTAFLLPGLWAFVLVVWWIAVPFFGLHFAFFLALHHRFTSFQIEIGAEEVILIGLFGRRVFLSMDVAEVMLDPRAITPRLEMDYWKDLDPPFHIVRRDGRRLMHTMMSNGLKYRIAGVLDPAHHPEKAAWVREWLLSGAEPIEQPKEATVSTLQTTEVMWRENTYAKSWRRSGSIMTMVGILLLPILVFGLSGMLPFSFVLVLMFIMVGGIILADIVSSRLSVIERIGLTATSLIVVHRDWKREFAWRSITAIERLPAKNGLRLHLSSEVPVQIPSLGGPLCTELETEWARKRTSAPSAAGP